MGEQRVAGQSAPGVLGHRIVTVAATLQRAAARTRDDDFAFRTVNERHSGANAYNTSYSYDPVGNRLTMNASGSVTQYSYNAANEQVLLTPASGA